MLDLGGHCLIVQCYMPSCRIECGDYLQINVYLIKVFKTSVIINICVIEKETEIGKSGLDY